MASGPEIRARIDTETVRGLQLINGGMAAGLVALLPAIVRDQSYQELGAWMTGGIVCGALGLACSVIHNRLRRKCSLEYAKKATRDRPYRSRLLVALQSIEGEPRVCTQSVIFMWSSLALFFMGAISVGTGFWRTWAVHPDPTVSCWALGQVAGDPVKFNSCTGTIQAVDRSKAQQLGVVPPSPPPAPRSRSTLPSVAQTPHGPSAGAPTGSHDDSWFPTLWSTALGAFMGGAAAFAVEWLRQIHEERRRKVGAANIALLTVFNMWWELFTYESQVVRPVVGRTDHPLPLWLRIRPLARRPPDLTLDVAALSFLLRSEEPTLLPRLIVQQQRYRDLVGGLQLRDVIIARASDRMDAAEIGRYGNPTDQQLVGVIGVRGVGELRTMTASMIRYLYDTLAEMAEVYRELTATLRKEVGRKNITAFDLEQEKLIEQLKPSPSAWVQAAIDESNSRPARGADATP